MYKSVMRFYLPKLAAFGIIIENFFNKAEKPLFYQIKCVFL